MFTYDVFICCKSEDYGLARKVYTFLVEKGYCVFLADTELRKKASAEYGKVIDSALDSAKHFIVVASRKEFLESSYVESEWRTFLEEKRAGRKRGNLLTILKGIDVSLLPISLRKYQSFPYSDFSQIINYLPLCNQITQGHESIENNTSIVDNKPNKMVLIIAILSIIIVSTFLYFIFGQDLTKEEFSNTNILYFSKNEAKMNDGEYMKIKNEELSSPLLEEKEKYLDVLCEVYQKHRIDTSPHDFYNQRVSNYPKIGDIVSEEEFLAKLMEFGVY